MVLTIQLGVSFACYFLYEPEQPLPHRIDKQHVTLDVNTYLTSACMHAELERVGAAATVPACSPPDLSTARCLFDVSVSAITIHLNTPCLKPMS